MFFLNVSSIRNLQNIMTLRAAFITKHSLQINISIYFERHIVNYALANAQTKAL